MANTPARSYDVAEVNLVVGGVIITGAAEGTFITAERNEDTFQEYIGSQGEVAFAETNNNSGTISVTLENTSPSISYLDGLANRKGQNAIVDVSIIDGNTDGGKRISGAQARVRRPANYEASAGITTRDYEIFVTHIIFKD